MLGGPLASPDSYAALDVEGAIEPSGSEEGNMAVSVYQLRSPEEKDMCTLCTNKKEMILSAISASGRYGRYAGGCR